MINLLKNTCSTARPGPRILFTEARIHGQLTIPPWGDPRKIRICPSVVSREIQNRLSPAGSKLAFSLAFSPLLLLQAAVRNNLPSVEQSITPYNESLTQCQNADPLIFHVVSPGTRAVTAPPNPGRIYTADLIHVVDAGPASCLDVAIHYSPPTPIRYLSTTRDALAWRRARKRTCRVCVLQIVWLNAAPFIYYGITRYKKIVSSWRILFRSEYNFSFAVIRISRIIRICDGH